jgi:hypothetical protein
MRGLHPSPRRLAAPRFFPPAIRLALAALLLCSLAPRLPAEADKGDSLRRSKAADAPTPTALQGEVMRFADLYASSVAQATDDFRVRVPTPEARLAAQNWKLYQSTAAFINAASQSPVVNALDMVVLATLSRAVQEDYWVGQVYGDAARPLLEAHRKLEAEAWTIAERMLRPEQLQEVRDLIKEWRARNPNQHYVAQTRLRDFAFVLGQLPAEGKAKKGSIYSLFMIDPLAGLEPAERAIEQTRLLAERGAYYMQRMPTLLSWQAELLSFQLAGMPEVKQALADSDRLTRSVAVFSKTADQLPALVNTQREAAIKQLLDGIAAERTALIATLSNDELKLRPTLAELRQTLEAGTELAKSSDSTVRSVDTLLGHLNAPKPGAPAAPAAPAGPPARPFDILDYATTARELTAALKEVNLAINSLDKSTPQLQQAGATLELAGNRLLTRLFLLGAALIVLLVGGAFLAALLYRRLAAARTPNA